MTAAPAAARARELPDVSALTVGVVGGTGPQGRGLAVRLAGARPPVVLRSLGPGEAGRAEEPAGQVAGRAATAAAEGVTVAVRGGSNVDVAGAADLLIMA